MMKKITAFVLALLCTLSLVACDGGEAEARLAAENFMNAVVALDKETLSGYMVEPSAIPEEMDEWNIDNIAEMLPPEMVAYTEDFKGAFAGFIDKVKSSLAYEIKECNKTEGGFIFTVALTTPDLENLDVEKILEEKFSETDMNAIALELINSGAITATSTQEELMDAVMPKVTSLMKEAFDKLTIQTETEDIDLILIQKDGKWLVDAGLDALFD